LYEEEIPYRRFKFPSLERFLMSIPDVCVISSRGGQVVVEGVASHGTGHIEKLVQRTGNKKGGGGWRGNQSDRAGPPLRKSNSVFPFRSALPPSLSSTPVRSRSSRVSSGSAARGGQTFYPKPSQNRGAEPVSVRSIEPGSWEVKQTGPGQMNEESQTIPTVEKPTKRDWELEITAVESSNEVWVNLRSQLEMKKQLEAELLQKHLSDSSASFSGGVMPAGNYFSAVVNSGEVRRVKVTKLDRINHTASCFLIDYGQKVVVPWRSLVPLQQQFWRLRAQAIKIQLSGFSLYHNVNVLEFMEKTLVGRRVVGREETEQSLSSPLVRIVEADLPGELSIEIIIEEMKLINLRQSPQLPVSHNNNSQEAGGLKPCQVPGVEEFYECVVSHVVGTGEIYLRSYHSVRDFRDFQHQLLAFYSAGRGRPVEKLEPGLAVATAVGEEWYRARVIMKIRTDSRPSDGSQVLVKLVDTGKVEVVSESSIRALEAEFLSLPTQALKVGLDGIRDGGEEAVVWLREFCRGKDLVGRVVGRQEDRLSIVLYDTTLPDVDININEEVDSLVLATKIVL